MNKKKLILTSGLANSFEWYDYALFGQLAPVIGAKFFPQNDPNVELLHALLIFAIGYLMRPIGGIVFGIIGDKFGRKTALSSSLMCMAVPTAAIGFLPSYESWGIISTSLMIIFRMIQGLSMGGALTGSVSFIIEHTKKNNRGFYGSITMSSICMGMLLGSLMIFIVKYFTSENQFLNWGWRVPFIIGIVIFFAGVYIKKNTAETPLFEEAKFRGEVLSSPLREVIKNYKFDLLIAILINSTGSIIFYLVAIYMMNYLRNNRHFSGLEISYLVNLGYVVMIFATILSGWLSDFMSRRNFFAINILLIIFITPYTITTFANGDYAQVFGGYLILSFLAAICIGPEPALQAEFYPTEVRSTALSVSYNIATSIFGGTAPYIIEYLVQKNGNITASLNYIIFMAIMSLIALYFYKDRSIDDYKVRITEE